MERIEFEYWSDPLCIWALVTQPKLERVLEVHGAHLTPRYHVVPVFGSIPKRFSDGAWARGGREGRAEATRRVAAQNGRVDISGECWLRDCPTSSWAAGVAVKAVFEMADDGEVAPSLAADYQVALRERFFVEARNVARRSEQLSLAEQMDIPRAPLERRLDDGTALCALFEDHERREALGLRGSPTFLFDEGRAMLYGNFSEAVLVATVSELVNGLTTGGSAC